MSYMYKGVKPTSREQKRRNRRARRQMREYVQGMKNSHIRQS